MPNARDEVALEGGLETLSAGVGDSIPLAIGMAIGVALLVFFLLPLIGVALEIVLLLMLLSSGIIGRVLLRRPWTIEAANLSHPQRSAAFAVKGWRRSSRAIEELTRTIPVSGLPPQVFEATPVSL
jgi:4-amino-4-deoxy-L-arabinose transferase-like glycosyltransferase